MNINKKTVLLFGGLFFSPVTAYSFVPSGFISQSFLLDKGFFVLMALFFMGVVIYLLSRNSADEIRNGLSEIGYLQRVNNCNLYVEGFTLAAEKRPEDVWENYQYVWKNKPHLFREENAKVMRKLEAQFG